MATVAAMGVCAGSVVIGGDLAITSAKKWAKEKKEKLQLEANMKTTNANSAVVNAHVARDPTTGQLTPMGYEQQMPRDVFNKMMKEQRPASTAVGSKKAESIMEDSEYTKWELTHPEVLKYEVELGWCLNAGTDVEPFARGSIHGSLTKGEENLRYVFTPLHAFLSWEEASTEKVFIRSMYDKERRWFSVKPAWVGVPRSELVSEQMRNTWKDLVAIELPQSFCSMYSLQKAPPSFDHMKFGRLTTFRWGVDEKGQPMLMYATGSVYDDPEQFAKLMSPHKVSTLPGQSGSVMYKWCGPRLIPYGIHVSGTNNREAMPYNLCINSAGIYNHQVRLGIARDPNEKIVVPKKNLDQELKEVQPKIQYCLTESKKYHKKRSGIFSKSAPGEDEAFAIAIAERALRDCEAKYVKNPKEVVLSDFKRAIEQFMEVHPSWKGRLQKDEKPVVSLEEDPWADSQVFDIPTDKIPEITFTAADQLGDPQTEEAKRSRAKKYRYICRFTSGEHSYPKGAMDNNDRIPKDTSQLYSDEWAYTDDQHDQEDEVSQLTVNWDRERQEIYERLHSMGGGMDQGENGNLGRRARKGRFGQYSESESEQPPSKPKEATFDDLYAMAISLAKAETFPNETTKTCVQKLAEVAGVMDAVEKAKPKPPAPLPIKEEVEEYPGEVPVKECVKVSEAKGTPPTVLMPVFNHIPDAVIVSMDITTGWFWGEKGESVIIHIVGLDGKCSVSFAAALAKRWPKSEHGPFKTTGHSLKDQNGLSLYDAHEKYSVGSAILTPADDKCHADVIHLVGKEFSHQCPQKEDMKKCADSLAKLLKQKDYKYAYFPLLGGGVDQDKDKEGRSLPTEWFSFVAPALSEAKTIKKKYLVTPPAGVRIRKRTRRNRKFQTSQSLPSQRPGTQSSQPPPPSVQRPPPHRHYARNIDHTLSVEELNLRSEKYHETKRSGEFRSEEERVALAEQHVADMLNSGCLDLTSSGPLAFARQKVLISDLEKIPTIRRFLSQLRTILGPRKEGEPYCPDKTGFDTLAECYEDHRAPGYNVRRSPMLPPDHAKFAMSDTSNDMISRRGLFKPFKERLRATEDIFFGLPMPPNSKEDIHKSLTYQLGRRLQGSFEGYEEQIDRTVESLLNEFDPVDPSQDLPYLDWTIRQIYDQLDLTKSQGWTEGFKSGTKKTWEDPIDFYELTKMVKLRLFIRMVFGAKAIAFLSPSDAVHFGLKDPEKLFIKDEPHSMEKLEAGKLRLIWAPSLIDTLILGVLTRRFDKQNIACFQHGDTNEYAVGMGHHNLGLARTGEAIADMMQRAKRDGFNSLYGADYSGYDISVTRDAMMEVSRLRKLKLDETKISNLHLAFVEELLDIEHLLLSAHVVQSGDQILEVRVFGIVGSGTLVTGSNNTLANLIQTKTAGARMMHVVSDDNIYYGRIDFTMIEKFGLVLKDTRECAIQRLHGKWAVFDLPFTSHYYSVSHIDSDFDPELDSFVVGEPTAEQFGRPNVQAVYANPSKLFSNLLHKTKETIIDQDILIGVAHALRHTPYLLEFFVNYATRLNPVNYRSITTALRDGTDFLEYSSTQQTADLLGCPSGVSESASMGDGQPEAEPYTRSNRVAPVSILPPPDRKVWSYVMEMVKREKTAKAALRDAITHWRSPTGLFRAPAPRGPFQGDPDSGWDTVM